MVVRRATARDSASLLSWRNDPVTRASALQADAIELAAHETWLAAKLSDAGCEIWIGEVDGVPVGQARFDLDDSGVALVDIAVAPTARGRGFGSELLALSVSSTTLPASRMRALVKRENTVSRSLFAGAGFDEAGFADECIVFERAVTA